MTNPKDLRVAWLIPSLALGNYWHPVFKELGKIYQHLRVYTGVWPGFSAGFENSFAVDVVGKMRFVDTNQSETGYGEGFIYASPAIVGRLLSFKPDVIFTTGFCIWTILAIVAKPLGRWRIVISYEGSSPGVDYRHSPRRLFLRGWMARLSDAFITNSTAGKHYLINYLGVDESKIFDRPYEVPDLGALMSHLSDSSPLNALPERFQTPVFLFTGQLVTRKGLHQLLKACKILREEGYQNYTLLVAGDGAQREELQAFTKTNHLEDSVQWLGWVSYGQLGHYFRQADVFILPTLEDTWGMVILESMAFGKPVLCSKWAGAAEMVVDQQNGYLFDPYFPEQIAAAMRQIIDHPELIQTFGQKSKELIADHTPLAAAKFLSQVTESIAGAR